MVLCFRSQTILQRAPCPELLAAISSATSLPPPHTPLLLASKVLRAPEVPLNPPAPPGLWQAGYEIVVTRSCCTEWNSGLSNSF